MFKRILIPVDMQDVDFSDKAMKIAIDQAINNKAELHVISVVPGFGMPMVASYFPKDAMEKALKGVNAKLLEYVKEKVPKELKPHITTLQGTHYKEILKESKRIKADLIVLASHNHHRMDKELLGSCASKVVERAKVSVMVIRPL